MTIKRERREESRLPAGRERATGASGPGPTPTCEQRSGAGHASAGRGAAVQLTPEEMDRLIGDLEQYAEFTVGRRVRELQAQGGR